jgi:hypothetical protein
MTPVPDPLRSDALRPGALRRLLRVDSFDPGLRPRRPKR